VAGQAGQAGRSGVIDVAGTSIPNCVGVGGGPRFAESGRHAFSVVLTGCASRLTGRAISSDIV
jgi:hypothetical protein